MMQLYVSCVHSLTHQKLTTDNRYFDERKFAGMLERALIKESKKNVLRIFFYILYENNYCTL